MSYQSREESREDAVPVNLLLFRYGLAATAIYTYTNAEQPIIRDSRVYAPIPVEADNIQSSGTLDRKTLVVRLPSSTEIAQLYRAYPPSYPVTLTIFRGHLSDDNRQWVVVWTGRVLNGKQAGDGSHVCELSCEPIVTAMRRNGLRRNYQFMCPHVLYGTQCRASRGAATITVLPTAIGSNYVDVPAGWDTPARIDKYTGGVIEWTTVEGNLEIRTVLDVESGTRIHMTGPTTGLTSQTVRISLGCNHQMSDCGDLHDNILNFGGQPWIPINHPFGTFYNTFY